MLYSQCNVVILGIKHCNSSIVANALVAAGWKRNDLNEHGESVSVVQQNQLLQTGEPAATLDTLISLEEPWVLKDPGFQQTLHLWRDAFARYEPLLIYLQKDHHKVLQSYLRRARPEWGRPYPITLDSIEVWDKRCAKQFADWPWKKIRLDVDKIGKACSMWNTTRSDGREDSIMGDTSTAFVSGSVFNATVS